MIASGCGGCGRIWDGWTAGPVGRMLRAIHWRRGCKGPPKPAWTPEQMRQHNAKVLAMLASMPMRMDCQDEDCPRNDDHPEGSARCSVRIEVKEAKE